MKKKKQRQSMHITRFGKDMTPKSNAILKVGSFLVIILTLFAVIVASIKIEEVILRPVYSTQFGEESVGSWISSLGSYWGAIIGGILSGAISLLGIVLTIRYYRNSDIEKNRLAIQPFLKMNFQSTSKDDSPQGVLFSKAETNQEKLRVRCSIKNIGRGFAQVITFNDGTNIGGIAYEKTIEAAEEIGDFIFIVPYYNFEFSLYLTFFDEYMNEYIQTFDIRVEPEKTIDEYGNKMHCLDVTSNYPQVLKSRL